MIIYSVYKEKEVRNSDVSKDITPQNENTNVAVS